MQPGSRRAKTPDFVPAFSHRLKPPMRDGSQFTRVLFHPRIDCGIPLDSAVESQQFRSHRRSAAPQNSLAVEELRARDFIYFNLLFERSCDFLFE